MRLSFALPFAPLAQLAPVALCALLAACGSTTASNGGSTADAATDTTEGSDVAADMAAADVQQVPQPTQPAAYTGTCPDFTKGGTVTMTSGGFKRSMKVSLPPDMTGPDNALLFLWHGLGDTAANFSADFDAPGIASAHNAVVITPDVCSASGCTQMFGWDFLDATGGADVQLFEDVISCVTQQINVEPRRIYSAGFSAGALWTTWLLINRADFLGSVAIFSGGIDPSQVPYVTPKWPIPVIGFYGSQSGDQFQGIVFFHDLMQALIGDLRGDKIFTVDCDDELNAHTIPDGGVDAGVEFMFNHKYGDKSSYEASGKLPKNFPDYCKIAP
jgi:predicted esterase